MFLSLDKYKMINTDCISKIYTKNIRSMYKEETVIIMADTVDGGNYELAVFNDYDKALKALDKLTLFLGAKKVKDIIGGND